MNDLLKKELETYKKQKPELLGKYKGKFALIKNNDIVDVFETESDAIRQGHKKFGNVPFLVKQILEVEIAKNFTSNVLAMPYR